MQKAKRVLLVDDVEFNIEFENNVIKSFTKETGVEVLLDVAVNVADALQKINSHPPYDAMVIDLNLPDGSGVDIAKAALKKSESTRLAALTIYPSKYEEHRAFFDMFLRKPIAPYEYKRNFAHLLQV